MAYKHPRNPPAISSPLPFAEKPLQTPQAPNNNALGDFLRVFMLGGISIIANCLGDPVKFISTAF
jgi:hypothetical protein